MILCRPFENFKHDGQSREKDTFLGRLLRGTIAFLFGLWRPCVERRGEYSLTGLSNTYLNTSFLTPFVLSRLHEAEKLLCVLLLGPDETRFLAELLG